jgi:RimJ/RimL family protein N-acetyltransferase
MAEDVDHILGWVNDPSIVGNIAAFSGEPFTREQELAYIAQMQASKSDELYSIFASRSAEGSHDDGADDSNAYVGQVGIHQIHWRSRVGRLGIVIADKARMGQGLGSAALASAIDIAFAEDQLNLHKLWLMVFSNNTRSLRTYKRLGFVEEGVLREEYFHDARWRDMTRLSLLQREWQLPT